MLVVTRHDVMAACYQISRSWKPVLENTTYYWFTFNFVSRLVQDLAAVSKCCLPSSANVLALVDPTPWIEKDLQFSLEPIALLHASSFALSLFQFKSGQWRWTLPPSLNWLNRKTGLVCCSWISTWISLEYKINIFILLYFIRSH